LWGSDQKRVKKTEPGGGEKILQGVPEGGTGGLLAAEENNTVP